MSTINDNVKTSRWLVSLDAIKVRTKIYNLFEQDDSPSRLYDKKVI